MRACVNLFFRIGGSVRKCPSMLRGRVPDFWDRLGRKKGKNIHQHVNSLTCLLFEICKSSRVMLHPERSSCFPFTVSGPHFTPLTPTICLKACLLLFLGPSLDNWLFLKHRQRTGRAWCFHHRRANRAVTDRDGIMTARLPGFQEIQFSFQSFLVVLCGTWPAIVLLGFFYGSISLIHFFYRNSCLRACFWGPQLRAAFSWG